jgi:hypothetical protein
LARKASGTAVLALVAAMAIVHRAGAQSTTKGKLCIAGAECRDALCGQRLTDLDERRTFTFAMPAATHLGVLKPGYRALACDGYSDLTLRVAAKLPKRTTARLAVSAANGDQWEVKLDGDQLRKPLALRVVPGAYRLELAAPHFMPARTSVTVAARPVLATLALQPAPLLSATVRDRRSRDPLIGAMIATDGGDSVLSDATGRFSLEPDAEKWPTTLTITASGYSQATVAVPRAHASKTLGDILLGRGGTIVVELTRGVVSEALSVELNKLPNGAMVAGPAVKSVDVPAGEQTAKVTFENIEPGDYDVLVKGSGPAERRGELVNILDAEVKHVSIELVPVRLHVRARYQDEPLRQASVRFKNIDGRWGGRFDTDDEGEATVQLWQGGKASVTLGAPSVFTAPYIETRELTDGDDTDWFLDVPGREITGVVVDAATGEPIPDARVILQTNTADGGALSSRTKAGNDGRFRYAPARYGKHTLTALAKYYLPAETEYIFAEPEQRRDLVVRLEHASPAQVTVVDSRGAPVGGARLAVFRGFEFVVFGMTDESGAGEVPRPIEQPYDVWAIPRDGSFGVAQVTAEAERATIRVADGASRIILKTESESHQPIPRVVLLIRYNGRLLPDVVLKAIGELQGVRIWTGSDGIMILDRMPTGLYEFWPVGSLAEMRVLAASAGQDAPAKVIAGPGENITVMTFAPAH